MRQKNGKVEATNRSILKLKKYKLTITKLRNCSFKNFQWDLVHSNTTKKTHITKKKNRLINEINIMKISM